MPHCTARPARTASHLLRAVAICAALAACSDSERSGSLSVGARAAPEPPANAQVRLEPADLPEGQRMLRFGVTPYNAPEALQEQLGPIAAHVSVSAGVPVQVVVATSYQDLVQRVVAGEIDLALLSPLSYVQARAQVPDLQLLARTLSHGALEYASYVVVHADDAAHSLADLKGRRIAWVDKLSTAGYLFPYAALRTHGVEPERDLPGSLFAGTHEAALRAMLEGRADAAAISSSTLAEVRGRLDLGAVRILHGAGRIPYDALCARPGIPAGGARKLASIFHALNTRSERGRSVLARSGGLTGWIPASDADYDGIRQVLARTRGGTTQGGGGGHGPRP